MSYPVAAVRGRTVQGAGAGAWWLAGGTILEANVLEHVELPTVGQDYAGATVADGQPWSVAFRTDSIESATNGGAKYVLACNANAPTFGMNGTNRGVYAGGAAWSQHDCFTDTSNHVWFFVCNGSSIACYLDNVEVGSPLAEHSGVGAASSKWRSQYNNAAQAEWPNAVQAGAVFDIALSSDQRAALYTSMAAL